MFIGEIEEVQEDEVELIFEIEILDKLKYQQVEGG
jgi:hypothetical protein